MLGTVEPLVFRERKDPLRVDANLRLRRGTTSAEPRNKEKNKLENINERREFVHFTTFDTKDYSSER
jgi:hypothetical protein